MLHRRSPSSEPVQGGDLLAFYGATQHSRPRGFWVYALHEANGTVFRVGQVGENSAGNLIGRLNEHIYTFGERFHHYSLIPCRDAHQADVFEAALIDFYQPSECRAGTAQVEALRRRIRQSASGSGLRPRAEGYRETG